MKRFIPYIVLLLLPSVCLGFYCIGGNTTSGTGLTPAQTVFISSSSTLLRINGSQIQTTGIGTDVQTALNLKLTKSIFDGWSSSKLSVNNPTYTGILSSDATNGERFAGFGNMSGLDSAGYTSTEEGRCGVNETTGVLECWNGSSLIEIIGGTISGSGLTAGHAYYINTSGVLTEADATSSATLPSPAICVAVSTTLCRKYGKWTTTGLTRGSVYYVPASGGGGALTTTAPSTSGNQVQRIGVASSTTVLEIMPSLDVLTVQ